MKIIWKKKQKSEFKIVYYIQDIKSYSLFRNVL
jgi:hypothetical protein